MPPELLMVSAPTPEELEARSGEVLERLEHEPDLPLVATTLREAPGAGRYRRVVVASDAADAVRRLRRCGPRDVFTAEAGATRPVAFLFSGVGDQYPGMTAGLYASVPRFRHELDHCLDVLGRASGAPLRDVLYPEEGARQAPSLADLFDRRASEQEIHQTGVAQPLAFATQYALARTLWSAGVRADVLLGYSVGEYVAACLAGVFRPDDALRLIARRAELVAALPEGAMLAVMSGPGPPAAHLRGGVSTAALDGAELTVLAGPAAAVDEVAADLAADGIATRRLTAAHAFHSPMMEPVVEPLRDLLASIPLSPPSIPFLSNTTGTWITDEEAVSPGYWAAHLREPVRFADDLAELWRLGDPALVELGPGKALTSLAARHPAAGSEVRAVTTVPGLFESRGDLAVLLEAAGRLWAGGVDVTWPALIPT